MKQLEQITVKLSRPFDGLNQASADAFYQATLSVIPLLRDQIISPFEKLLKENTGFSNENLPADVVMMERTYGPVDFGIESQGREKRPSYATVVDGLNAFLEHVQDDHGRGIKRRGLRTFDDKPYVEIDAVVEQVEELRQGVSQQELKQTITYKANVDDLAVIAVPLVQRVALTESDAVRYVQSRQLEKRIKEGTVEPFTQALREQTGYKKGNVPAEMVNHWVQVGSHLISVQIIPEETVKYAEMLKALMGEGTRRTLPGEFLRIQGERQEIPSEYDVREKEGRRYVSVSGTIQRLQELKREHTKKSDNVRVYHYPLVER
ncbi:hypothetical protein J4421_05210 [Candidatus Woesearchaeota archaeon]|nr:hypothetical protein [Candidatus Woesearchaeota archaeon]